MTYIEERSVRVQLHIMPDLHIVTNPLDVFSIVFMFPVGSWNEKKQHAGMAHLLEHLLFQAKNHHFHEKLKALGGKYNASTSIEFTRFTLTTTSDKYADAISIMKRVLETLEIDKNILEREKDIVRQEMVHSANNLKSVVDIMFAGTPYDRDILGDESSLENITLKDLETFHKKEYANRGCVICVSCPPSQKSDVRRTIKKHFASYPRLPNQIEYDLEGVLHAHKKDNVIRFSELSDYGAEIGLVTKKYDRETALRIDFLTHVMAGFLDSKWYKVMRREKRLVYSLQLSAYTYSQMGVLVIGGKSKDSSVTLLSELCKLISETARQGIVHSIKSIEREKDTFKTQMKLRMKDPSQATEFIARDMFYARTTGAGDFSPRAYIDMVDRITRKEVNDLARQILSGPKYVVLGNNTDESEDQVKKRVRGILAHCDTSARHQKSSPSSSE